MKYKLLAIDLDGTLTDSNKQISPRTLSVLLHAQRCGTKIVIASGRPTHGIAPIANLLRLNEFGGYVLSFNGGEITNWQTGDIIWQKEVNKSYLPYLYESTRKHHLAIETFNGQYAITETPNDKYIQRQAAINNLTITCVPDFLEAVNFSIIKCLIVGESEKLEVAEKELQEKLEGELGIFRSEPYFLEIVAKDIDKARSLCVLLQHLKLQREELIAIGDGYNDISMIRYAGLGVVMENAMEVVKREADIIAPSNDNEGVAKIVEQLFNLT
ncbi:MAG: Cof-type HAD-IIB family hydrolase [Phocaeicola sp.]|uniref:Cof-type HAD-IIB family hydrolase n=1 Tax=Phocaeicola sp. TaxID=2773926 RepID=UPI003F9F7ABA